MDIPENPSALFRALRLPVSQRQAKLRRRKFYVEFLGRRSLLDAGLGAALAIDPTTDLLGDADPATLTCWLPGTDPVLAEGLAGAGFAVEGDA